MSKDADVLNAGNEFGCTPLFVATVEDQLDEVMALLSKHADVNKANEVGATSLHAAAMNNREAIMRALLAVPGVNIDVEDCDGDTPLQVAIDEGHKVVAQLLADEGARVENMPAWLKVSDENGAEGGDEEGEPQPDLELDALMAALAK
jgi:ankyrin repeat protein